MSKDKNDSNNKKKGSVPLGITDEEARKMSLKFADEVRGRGLRILWDPQVVLRLK